ncbi:MAG: hypothetical protein RL720_796 [Actinomycetota bacterium]
MKTFLASGLCIALASSFALVGCSSGVDTSPSKNAGASSETPVEIFSRSYYREVTVSNKTLVALTLRVSATDSYDWENNRPDRAYPHGFNGLTLEPGQSKSVLLNLNEFANGHPWVLDVSASTGGTWSDRLVDTICSEEAHDGQLHCGWKFVAGDNQNFDSGNSKAGKIGVSISVTEPNPKSGALPDTFIVFDWLG